jgi:hypothetical protein
VIGGKRPVLIHGRDLRSFLEARRPGISGPVSQAKSIAWDAVRRNVRQPIGQSTRR